MMKQLLVSVSCLLLLCHSAYAYPFHGYGFEKEYRNKHHPFHSAEIPYLPQNPPYHDEGNFFGASGTDCLECPFENRSCLKHCRPPDCSSCSQWDPNYIFCLRICHSSKDDHEVRGKRCNPLVWGSWCGDRWFIELPEAKKAEVLRSAQTE
ncbi:unnamed protein product [Soboliphyme baturini]|uniref:Metastriate insulin growth factor binding protein n=1 Tax=Soboliphyme baturini TaxID=241478 RepID=A0A183J135_9BILA|nr:unnamed protein product [Soboliphyme baturini]